MHLPRKKHLPNNKNNSNQKEFQESKTKKIDDEKFAFETATKMLVRELSFSAN